MRRLFTWMRRLVVGGLAIALVWGVVVLGPYVYDDVVLDWVVRAVALDWRDFGEQTARTRLQYELDYQGISLHVADHNCELTTLAGGARRVRCAWGVWLRVPGTQHRGWVPFGSQAVVGADGSLGYNAH